MSLSKNQSISQPILAAIVLLFLLGISKHFLPFDFFGQPLGFLLVAVYQLYLPLFLIRKMKENPENYGIWAHGFFGWLWCRSKILFNKKTSIENSSKSSGFNFLSFKGDLKRTFLVCLITLPPYAILYSFIQSAGATKLGLIAHFDPNISWGLVSIVLSNTLLVCLPEEVFYRGFLQSSLLRAMPNRFFILGVPLGRAVIFTSAFFALGHFVGEYSLYRLTPFFPSLLFSMLAFKSGSIMGAILYHAICNTLSIVLQTSYVWS